MRSAAFALCLAVSGPAIALEVILERAPDYEIVGPVHRFASHMDRGIDRLPATLGSGAVSPPT